MNNRMKRMDYLMMDLIRLEDYDYVEKILDKYRVLDYGKLPLSVSEKVEQIFDKRLKKLKKLHPEPNFEDEWI